VVEFRRATSEDGGSCVLTVMGHRRRTGREQRRLAEALRAGAPDGIRDLHAWLGPVVFGYLLQTLPDRATAEDVFQQVWAEAWRRGGDFDETRGSLTGWVLMIARSRAIDELRRRRPEPMDVSRLPEDEAEAELDQLAERWHVAQLLLTLPDEERTLLKLRFYEDLSQTEIAERTGVPLGTVKTRMVRGLERLQALLVAERRVEHTALTTEQGL
jgi:RNA polymerase sigma-70 factor, ECF subfamily